MNGRVLAALAAVLVALAALGAYLWWQQGANDPAAAFSLSGNVDVHQVELAFRVTGRISGLKAQEGDKVSAGTTLGQIDREPFKRGLASAQVDVGQARA